MIKLPFPAFRKILQLNRQDLACYRISGMPDYLAKVRISGVWQLPDTRIWYTKCWISNEKYFWRLISQFSWIIFSWFDMKLVLQTIFGRKSDKKHSKIWESGKWRISGYGNFIWKHLASSKKTTSGPILDLTFFQGQWSTPGPPCSSSSWAKGCRTTSQRPGRPR